jgi:hypothetical protein
MVHFFGIFSPTFGQRTEAAEAPHKTGFFGGLPDAATGAVPLSRAEQDACFLNGKLAWEPDPVEAPAFGSLGNTARYRP